MSAFRHRRLRILTVALGVLVAVFIFARPATAHAIDLLGLGSLSLNFVLDLILNGLITVNTLLGQLMSAAASALTWVLSLQIATNLEAVLIAWTFIRNVCNLVFIVVFIGISFGTIFNATGWIPAGWHFRTALMPLVIAAILMNFSLAIGKAIVLASNQATRVVLTMVKDPGDALIKALKPNNLALGVDMNARAALSAPIVDTTKTLTDAENTRFQNCLKEEKTVVDTNASLFRYGLNLIGVPLPSQKVRKGVGDCNLEINDARYGTTPDKVAQAGQQIAAGGSEIPQGDTNQKLAFIADLIFKAIMILMIVSCLLTAFVFLGLRIVVMWALLAISPLAWASYAIPGSKGQWGWWWKNTIAWNVFGPLYLLSLIPGLVMIAGTGDMMLQLSSAGGSISTASMLVQQFFIYAFAVLIFLGGLAMSLKSSFAGSVKGTAYVGGLAEKLGVFDTSGAAPLRFLGEQTGATAAARGAGGALYEKYTKPFRNLGASQEQVEARFRQLATGDKGAMEALQRKEIDEQIKKNKESGRSNADLRGDMKSIGSPKYFAAAKTLLDAGELSPAEMGTYAAAAARVSPTFGRTVKESVDRKMKERAKEKKFKNAADATAALDAYKPDPKDTPAQAAEKTKMRDDIQKGLERNQPLIASELASQGYYPGKTPEQIIEANFSALEPKDIRSVLDRARAGSLRRTPDMDRLIAGRNRKLADHLNLVADATPQQQAEIQQILTTAGIRPRP